MGTDQEKSGILRWRSDADRLEIEFDGGRRNVTHPERDLDAALFSQSLPALDGIRVDFTWKSGQARLIRGAGLPTQRRATTRRVRHDAFYNPYTFIPALPRGKYAPGGVSATGKTDGLGDGAPVGHHRAAPDRWTGKIGVRLRTATPLLLLDAPSSIDPDTKHATYPVLLRDAKPYLASTAVKGMLRSAYEAITNSRFGVFVDHDARLGTRMAAEEAKRMVPARVSDDGRTLTLLPGDTALDGQSRSNPLLHAAWLPSYGQAAISPGFVHGETVDALVELFQHHRWDNKAKCHKKDFQMWRVRAIASAGQRLPDTGPTPGRPATNRHSWYEPLGRKMVIQGGYVMRTGRNFSKKHDERIFFAGKQPTSSCPLGEELRRQWQEVVADYRAAHRPTDISGGRGPDGPAGTEGRLGPGEGTVWSPHQYDDAWLTLRPGQLCYAHVTNGKVDGVYPVMIARRLFEAAPSDLLDKSLRPATALNDLSPADRVFGWVRDRGPGAYRGQLRVGPVSCVSGSEAVETFIGEGVPLAILGQPKPQQARFYTGIAKEKLVTPLPDGYEHDGQKYQTRHSLRGRKTYPHHAGLTDDYWNDPAADRTQQIVSGRYQEYRRPHASADTVDPVADKGKTFKIDPIAEQRTDQNRSITGWIKPHQEFTFDIEVTNLSDLELGALAWLLALPEEAHHRLGLGKPLGFGSVRLTIDADRTSVHRGNAWDTYYRTFSAANSPVGDAADLATLGKEFEDNVPDLVAVFNAFKATAIGDGSASVHYPRIRPNGMRADIPVPPDPRGRSFEWFTANSSRYGKHRSLPEVGATLPIDAHEEH